jgi:hypothetical protein
LGGLFVPEYRLKYVSRILHAVDVADLVAVIGWNRHFLDPEVLMIQFDNDFCVEVKIIGHF